MTKQADREHEEARRFLLDNVEMKPGNVVYTVLKHVSCSGMYRVIDLYVMRDNEPWRISGYAGQLLEGYDQRHEGCKAGGCGMDMGFHLVYNLGWVLWPDGYNCVGKKCQSSAHFGRERVKPSSELIHRDGYALSQRWMG